MIQAVRELEEKVKPDWLIVETTGAAYLTDLQEKMQEYITDFG